MYQIFNLYDSSHLLITIDIYIILLDIYYFDALIEKGLEIEKLLGF